MPTILTPGRSRLSLAWARRATATPVAKPAAANSLEKVAPYRPFGTLRFLLAVVVALDHCRFVAGPEFAQRLGPWVLGNIGVFSFFILSGFIIAEALHSFYAGRARAFLANRLLRLIPPYAAALVVSIAVHAWLSASTTPQFIAYDAPPPGMYSARNLALNTALPFAWYGLSDVGLAPDYPFVRYAWAISVEFWFYLFFAAAAALYGRASRLLPQRGILSAGLRSLLAAAGFVGAWWLYQAFWDTRSNWLYPFYYGPYFALGVALYYLVRKKSLLALAGVLFFGKIVVQHYIPYSYSTWQAEVGAGVLLGAAALLLVLDRLRLPAAWRHGDRMLGDLSYPLYLNHYVVSIFFLSMWPARSPAAMAACLAASVGVSCVLTWAVEPLTRTLRDRFRGVVLR